MFERCHAIAFGDGRIGAACLLNRRGNGKLVGYNGI